MPAHANDATFRVVGREIVIRVDLEDVIATTGVDHHDGLVAFSDKQLKGSVGSPVYTAERHARTGEQRRLQFQTLFERRCDAQDTGKGFDHLIYLQCSSPMRKPSPTMKAELDQPIAGHIASPGPDSVWGRHGDAVAASS